MIKMHFPSEGHDFFHISHKRAGNDITPSLLIPVSSEKFFLSCSALCPSSPKKEGDKEARDSSTTQ